MVDQKALVPLLRLFEFRVEIPFSFRLISCHVLVCLTPKFPELPSWNSHIWGPPTVWGEAGALISPKSHLACVPTVVGRTLPLPGDWRETACWSSEQTLGHTAAPRPTPRQGGDRCARASLFAMLGFCEVAAD